MPPQISRPVDPDHARRPSRQKVAIVYPFFAHYRAPVLRELLDHGAHDYYLLGDTRDPAGGIPTIDFSNETRFVRTRCRYLKDHLIWQSGLVGAAIRGQYDCYVFLGNAAWPTTWIASLICRLSRHRVLFWTHGWVRIDRGARRWVRNAFYRLAHGLLLYGEHARQIGIAGGFRSESLHVIYNSLDYERQAALLKSFSYVQIQKKRTELFGTSEIPVVIATARLTRTKRFDLLLHAVGSLQRLGKKINVLVVGDGPERLALQQLAAAEGITAVFTGACYDEEELALLFSVANVTVSPGNVGLTCMHSLAYGVPVVTHDDPTEQMPEWESIVPGVNGGLFRKDSAESLARAILPWIATPHLCEAQRQNCVESLRHRYHPAAQRKLIDAAVGGAVSPPNLSAPLRPMETDF